MEEANIARQVVLSAGECEDALQDLCLASQEGVTFMTLTSTDWLYACKEKESGLLVCGERIQIFNQEETAAPILLYEAWMDVNTSSS